MLGVDAPSKTPDVTFDAPLPFVARCFRSQQFNLAAGGFTVLLLAEVLLQRLL